RHERLFEADLHVSQSARIVVDLWVQKTKGSLDDYREIGGKRVFKFDTDILVVDAGFDEARGSRITTIQWWGRSGRMGVGARFAKATALGVKKFRAVGPDVIE